MKALTIALVIFHLMPAAAAAQGFGEKVMAVFSAPVHPIVESVGPGGGFGAGVAYSPKLRANEPWSFRTKALITPRRYWDTEATFQYTTERVHAEAYGRAREMTRLDFYGLGRDALLSNRASFRYSDRTIGGLASVPLRLSRTGLRIGARAEAIFPDVGAGGNPDIPSLEEAFTDADAPGLVRQPNFAAYTGFVVLQFPDDLNQLSRFGGDVRASYTSFREMGGSEYDFGRVTLEGQQRLPGLRDGHKLTLHQLYSGARAASGSRVPFYLMQTLGGVGDVRSFNDQILGSDATKATLRGFRDLRFRGPYLLLLQAEYRLKVRGPVDMTAFLDAGTVATRRGALDLSRLRHSYGFSTSVMTIDATAVRADFGFGGSEGFHVFFSVGPIFQQ
jgi:hypothetical protein